MYCMIIFIIFAKVFSGHSAEIWKCTELVSVTNFHGIEEFYLNRRQQVFLYDLGPQLGLRLLPKEPADVTERGMIKQIICKNIFTSPFFQMQGINWVDISQEEVLHDLRTHHRHIFLSIYDEQAFPPYRYEYRNAYVERQIRLSNGTVRQDYVFKCIAKNRAQRIVAYYISRAYDVNALEAHLSVSPLAGRFIFTNDETRNALVMEAMAEQPVVGVDMVRTSGLITLLYMWDRWSEELPEVPEQDPVCSLSPAKKLRLCSTLLNEETLREKVSFIPDMNNVQINCERREISITFLSRFFRRPFEEWVLQCRALDRRTNEPVFYYVSKSPAPNMIYVYTNATDQKLSLYNFYFGVSVVRPTIMNIAVNTNRNQTQMLVLFLPDNREAAAAARPRRGPIIEEIVED